MLIKIRKASESLSSEITTRAVYADRRHFLRTAAVAGAGLMAAPFLAARAEEQQSRVKLEGATHNATFSTNEDLTDYDSATGYNNFYEFGTDKQDPARYAHTLRTRPWAIEVDGACAKPGILDIESLLGDFPLEERIYRLRCVEAWSMVIPWIGVPLGAVLSRFEPLGSAKYVAFETLYDPEQMPGQRRRILQWPYVEGLRLDEANHPLTLLTVGMYGEIIPNQNGAPVRLVVPWKYGFKSIKSIVRLSLVEDMPPTSWNRSAPREYGFYANVNPEVDHPRWSQANERRIGEFFRRDTLMFNGYAEEVASLYSGMDLAAWY